MNKKKFKELVFEVTNEIGMTAYETESTLSVLQLVVEEVNNMESNISEAPPISSLHGILLLLHGVNAHLKELQKTSEEMLRLSVLVEKDTKDLVTESVRAGVAALGYDLSEHDITIGDIADLRCVVNIDGKRFGIWDAVKKTFVD